MGRLTVTKRERSATLSPHDTPRDKRSREVIMGHEVIKTGWLMKQGGGNKSKSYKKRLFVLGRQAVEGVCFIAYFKKDSPLAAGVIYLDGNNKIVEETDVQKSLGKKFCIAISTGLSDLGARTFYLSADTEEDHNAWMTDIKAALEGEKLRVENIENVSFPQSRMERKEQAVSEENAYLKSELDNYLAEGGDDSIQRYYLQALTNVLTIEERRTDIVFREGEGAASGMDEQMEDDGREEEDKEEEKEGEDEKYGAKVVAKEEGKVKEGKDMEEETEGGVNVIEEEEEEAGGGTLAESMERLDIEKKELSASEEEAKAADGMSTEADRQVGSGEGEEGIELNKEDGKEATGHEVKLERENVGEKEIGTSSDEEGIRDEKV